MEKHFSRDANLWKSKIWRLFLLRYPPPPVPTHPEYQRTTNPQPRPTQPSMHDSIQSLIGLVHYMKYK